MTALDYIDSDFGLPAELEEIRRQVRRFAAEQIAPRAAHIDRSNEFPRDLWPALGAQGGARLLEVAGGAGRLSTLARADTVAIVGSTRASDYGLEIARSLACELTVVGVTVVARLCDGIAAAAHLGAVEAGGASIAAIDGGLAVSCPASRRALCCSPHAWTLAG